MESVLLPTMFPSTRSEARRRQRGIASAMTQNWQPRRRSQYRREQKRFETACEKVGAAMRNPPGLHVLVLGLGGLGQC
eukprot:2550818-Rhodomonas_salina.1